MLESKRSIRILTAVSIGLGVLILLGTTAIVVTIIKRASAPTPVTETVPMPQPAGHAFTTVLTEPAGTRIEGITDAGGRLAIALQGGGPDRVVLIDPRTGRAAGRISIGH